MAASGEGGAGAQKPAAASVAWRLATYQAAAIKPRAAAYRSSGAGKHRAHKRAGGARIAYWPLALAVSRGASATSASRGAWHGSLMARASGVKIRRQAGAGNQW